MVKSILQTIKDQFLAPASADFQNWEKMAAFLVSHFGDDSIRDNTQSHYGNAYYIEDQLDYAKSFNNVLKEVKAQGYNPARVEVTGGANVLESVRRMADNPFHIVREDRKAMPEARLGMLLRGRQGSFYAPIPVEVQEKLVDKFIKEGVTDFSVFDMLNDESNYLPTMKHLIKRHIEQRKAGVSEDRLVRLEICQSYITEPLDNEGNVKKAKVWGNTSFANGYVSTIEKLLADVPEEDRKYIDKKTFCLKDKDYAGLKTTERLESFMNKTNAVLNKAFEDKRIPFVPQVIVHSHGEKPEMMANAFGMENIEYVDTGVGALSGGNAHTNMINILKSVCEKIGVGFANIENTKVVKAIREVEEIIEPINDILKPSFAKGLSQDVVDQLRMAGGGIAALDNIIREPFNTKIYDSANNAIVNKFVEANPSYKDKKEELHKLIHEDFNSLKAKVYDLIPDMWEIGGRFHTVTPGAKILSDAVVTCAVRSREIKLDEKGNLSVVNAIDHVKNDDLDKIIPDLVPAYKMIMKGRFGENKGVELLGLENFRSAILISDFVKEAQSVLGAPTVSALFERVAENKEHLNNADIAKTPFYKLVKDNPNLVEGLKNEIERFGAKISNEQTEHLKTMLTVGKIEESYEQYIKRTDYEKNLSETLKIADGSKKWSVEDIEILCYDPTAVKDLQNALRFEKGIPLVGVTKMQSRNQYIAENIAKHIVGMSAEEITGVRKTEVHKNENTKTLESFVKKRVPFLWSVVKKEFAGKEVDLKALKPDILKVLDFFKAKLEEKVRDHFEKVVGPKGEVIATVKVVPTKKDLEQAGKIKIDDSGKTIVVEKPKPEEVDTTWAKRTKPNITTPTPPEKLQRWLDRATDKSKEGLEIN